jgi:hypothetical protein
MRVAGLDMGQDPICGQAVTNSRSNGGDLARVGEARATIGHRGENGGYRAKKLSRFAL